MPLMSCVPSGNPRSRFTRPILTVWARGVLLRAPIRPVLGRLAKYLGDSDRPVLVGLTSCLRPGDFIFFLRHLSDRVPGSLGVA